MPADASKPEPPSRRRYLRRDVSLRMRFTVTGSDGDATHLAVVTSLSGDGGFVQTHASPPIGARIQLVIPLGRELGELHAVARVIHLNKRTAAHVVPGFGLQLVEPTDEMRQRMEKFVAGYGTAAPLDREGRLAWPFGIEAGPGVADASGLAMIEVDGAGPA